MGCSNSKPVLMKSDIETLCKAGKMNESQLREHFKNFLDENPTGKITKESFRKLISHLLPKESEHKMEQHVFRTYDTNNDGQIDFREFMVAYYHFILSEETHEENLGSIFKMFDIDGDGFISKGELQTLVTDINGFVQSGFGSVTPVINYDLAASREDAALVDESFHKMDKNRDGKVSREEFINACLKERECKLLAQKISYIRRYLGTLVTDAVM